MPMAKPALPLSLAKAHLRVEHDLEDALIVLMAEAAVDHCLDFIGVAGMLTETVSEFPRCGYRFLYPVASVTAVERWNPLGTWDAMDTDAYTVRGSAESGYELAFAATEPVGKYRVRWEAGFDPLPASIQLAALFLLANSYENRAATVVGQGVAAVELPHGVKSLLNPWRRILFA
jgi:uncharacterized phiE125 gp8 family phage protein